MDFVNVLEDALNYTKEGIFGRADRWTKLIIAIICLGIPLNGYVMRIYRGAQPAPEVDEWGTLFIDGIRLLIVGLIYTIPILIVWILTYGLNLMRFISAGMDSSVMDSWSPNLGLMILMNVIEIIVAILLPVASIRFARTGSFSEAFNFNAIIDTIKRIGWINYVVAIVLIAVVIGIPLCIIIFGLIIVGGIVAYLLGFGVPAILAIVAIAVLILLIIMPLIGVFQARYMTRIYDSAVPEA
ncbi:MAG: DUF4013 domain-containing protein [Methanoregula sp.]|nr:DUF4013 domain-containing protein [Methanoregula sp.]